MTPEPCNPDRLPADRLVFAGEIHDQFVQAFGQWLANDLDAPIRALPAGIDQVPMGEFLSAGAADACLLTFDLSPTRGQAWAGLSGGMVFRVLDALLGAPQAEGTAAPRGSLTEIEQHLLADFFHAIETTLDRAWKSSGISLRLASVGTVEQVRQAIDPESTALALNCKVKFGEEEETFRVAVPVLAVRMAALQTERQATAEMAGATAARLAMLETVGGATLQIEAVLGGSTIRLGDLAALQPGQVLMLSRPAGSQLECLVNGKTKFRGEWVSDGARHGLHVETVVDAEP